MKIAIDITGGDLSPQANLEASIKFAKNFPNVELILLLLESQIPSDLPKNVTIKCVNEVIEMCDDPATSFRKKRDSAINVGTLMVKNHEVDAFISSGSSGALMSAATINVGRINGIERPAFPIFFKNPEKDQMRMYLDMGASVDAKPTLMLNYAKLGTKYCQTMLNITNPEVKLLNNGIEPSKGTKVYQESYQLMMNEQTINFTGNIEGYDLLTTNADVIVMDGFVGNLLLKTLEGTFDFFKQNLKTMMSKNIKGKIAAILLASELKTFKETINPHKIACTPILGLKGLVVKVHGSATNEQFYNALVECQNLVENKLIERLANYEN